jgi:iron(III) transport system permease protein
LSNGHRRLQPRTRISGLALCAGAIVLAVAAPFVALGAAAWPGSPELWTHLVRYVLPAATRDTVVLLAGVGALTAAIGTGLAWLVTACDFPGRRLLDSCLVLPLAVPTYIVAYAYLDILHPIGPVQEMLRWVLGYEGPREFRLPDIRSMVGCISVLGCVLYPYVYLPTRAIFAMQSASLLETGRTLGLTRAQAFTRVALPLARPAIAIGLSLALMEALNDIGASEFLGIRTLTVTIYSTWVTRSDLAGAAQIALGLLTAVLALVLLERWARRHQRYANDAQHPRPIARTRLSVTAATLAVLVTACPIVVGFGVPFLYLVHAAAVRIDLHGLDPSMFRAVRATVLLSVVATTVALGAGLALAYAVRRLKPRYAATILTISSVGYATPGTVVAIALLPIVTGIDRLLSAAIGGLSGVPIGLLLMGTGGAVVYAYVVRFLAVSVGGTESASSKVSPSLDDAAATLGAAPRERLWHVHLPLIRRGLIAAAVLIFVDCMKELPATLLLRPLGVETLATLLYGEAARGTYENGAIAALLIVSTGVVPVLLLSELARRDPSPSGDGRVTEALSE